MDSVSERNSLISRLVGFDDGFGAVTMVVGLAAGIQGQPRGKACVRS
jgi:hypothetical protein